MNNRTSICFTVAMTLSILSLVISAYTIGYNLGAKNAVAIETSYTEYIEPAE